MTMAKPFRWVYMVGHKVKATNQPKQKWLIAILGCKPRSINMNTQHGNSKRDPPSSYPSNVMSQYGRAGMALLNSVYQDMQQPETFTEAFDRLFWGLRRLRSVMSATDWKNFSEQTCIQHPLCKLLHQDPLTRRSYEKPRGYAGDALMLDFIYEIQSPQTSLEQTPLMGRRVHQYLMGAPAACAVRNRRLIAAHELACLVQSTPSPAVLSIACGCLREASLSLLVQESRFSRFIALDQDVESLALVEQEYAKFGIEPLYGTVIDLLAGRINWGAPEFDFIYALGLFDYLSQPVACRLTKCMFNMLRSGGTILFGNFLPDIRDVGYMESFMGWKLIYRDIDVLAKLGVEIPCDQIVAQKPLTEGTHNIGLIEMVRK